MNFKKNFKIKPSRIENGIVYFTDGTDEISANEKACVAYGYKYDKQTDTCRAFNYKPSVVEMTKLKSKSGNKEINSDNNIITGQANNVFQTDNSLVVGQNHKLEDTINSSVIAGKNALVNHYGEVGIGGGASTNGFQQMTIIQLGNRSVGNDVSLLVQNNSTKSQEITVTKNSFYIYDIHIIGLVYGGTSGTAGNYQARQLKGYIKVNNDGEITSEGQNTLISSSGSTGTVSLDFATPNTFKINIAGATNVNCEWAATAILYKQQISINF